MHSTSSMNMYVRTNTVQQNVIWSVNTVAKIKLRRVPFKTQPDNNHVYYGTTATMTLGSRSPLLLGHCSRHFRKWCAGASMVYSRAEHVFILEHYFESKSYAAVYTYIHIHKAFSNTDKEVLNKTTIHWLVTKFTAVGSVCFREGGGHLQ
jgi:hypothetical protein